jgi:hypothetical protein
MIKATVVCVGVGLLAASAAEARTVQGAHLRGHHHHHFGYPYGYGYGGYGPVATYTPTEYGQTPLVVLPAQVSQPAVIVAPRCTPTRETVTVPAEGGGERQVTITRCP